jgi:hypothetical protein
VAFAFANALCIYRAVVHGLGAHVEGLGEGDRETYYKVRLPWLVSRQSLHRGGNGRCDANVGG